MPYIPNLAYRVHYNKWMRCLRCVIYILVGLWCSIVRASQQPFFIDLTTPEALQKERSITHGCGGAWGVFTSHGPVPPTELPVSVRIERLNRKSYKIGEEIVSEVTLTNNGKSPLAIPITQEQEKFWGKDCHGLSLPAGSKLWNLSLSLVLTAPSLNSEIVSAHFLYGNSNDKSTYQLLMPGAQVRIRISGNVYLLHYSEEHKDNPYPARSSQWDVSAHLRLEDSSVMRPYKEVDSSNQIPVQVAAPEER